LAIDPPQPGKTMTIRSAALMLTFALGVGPSAQAATFWPATGKPLTPAQVQALAPHHLTSASRQVVLIDDQIFPEARLLLSGFSGRPWPGGKLIYSFDASVTASEKLVFVTSCGLWAAAAKVSCVARTTEASYDIVKSSSVNNADVGMPTGQGEINIYNWNMPYKVAHEIGHALGLAHEQSRRDRDSYVQIITANITTGMEHNFNKYTTDNAGTAYDFASVMHYGGTDFGVPGADGKPKMTIKVLPPNEAMQRVIGQRSKLSDIDEAGMAARYGKP
jgi:hypothetical protein